MYPPAAPAVCLIAVGPAVDATDHRTTVHTVQQAAFHGAEDLFSYLAHPGHADLLIDGMAEGTGVGLDDVHCPWAFAKVLELHPLFVWQDRIDALPGRFDNARELAARSLEPETQTVDIPHRTLRSTEDVDAWVKDVHEELKKAVAKGPVVIR